MPRGMRYGYSTQAFATIRTRKCSACGKKFECSIDTIYKIETKNGAEKVFCGYKCWRTVQKPLEEARREKFEKQNANFERMIFRHEPKEKDMRRKDERQTPVMPRIVAPRGRPESRVEKAERLKKRIEYARAKIAVYTGEIVNTETGTQEHVNAVTNRRRWRMKLRKAEDELAAVRLELEEMEEEVKCG